MGKYCCDSMQIAVEEWGGVYWDEDKKCWMGEFEHGGESTLAVIKICTWCHAILPQGEGSEMSFEIEKVIIRGEMPINCSSCDFCIWYKKNTAEIACTTRGDMWCEIIDRAIDGNFTTPRPDWCPLVTHNQAFDWMFKEAKATVYIKEQIEKIMLKGR